MLKFNKNNWKKKKKWEIKIIKQFNTNKWRKKNLLISTKKKY